MANTKSAAKRARQSITRTQRNRSVLTGIKSHTKTLRTHLTAKATPEAAVTKTAYQALVSELDRAVKRGIIHKNAANRRKGNLAKAVHARHS